MSYTPPSVGNQGARQVPGTGLQTGQDVVHSDGHRSVKGPNQGSPKYVVVSQAPNDRKRAPHSQRPPNMGSHTVTIVKNR